MCSLVQNSAIFSRLLVHKHIYMSRLLCDDHISNFYTLWPFKNFEITLLVTSLSHIKISALGTDFVHIKSKLLCNVNFAAWPDMSYMGPDRRCLLRKIAACWAWTLDVILIALVSKVTLLVWLSNFAQCALHWVRLNPVARIPWAPSTKIWM